MDSSTQRQKDTDTDIKSDSNVGYKTPVALRKKRPAPVIELSESEIKQKADKKKRNKGQPHNSSHRDNATQVGHQYCIND